MSALAEFRGSVWLSFLADLATAPPSQLDPSLAARMKTFSAETHSDVEIWNFYKEMLDLCVRCAAGAPFVMAALNLEPHYHPPVGALCIHDGSIDKAPWRLAADGI